jgi:hypothetical protein
LVQVIIFVEGIVKMFATASNKLIRIRAETSTRDLYKLIIAILICIGSLGYVRVFYSQQLSLNVSTIACSPRSKRPIVLTRREQRGSWIGNTWIPPKGWKYYSEDELIEFYRDRSLLWVGDSTGWGASLTLFETLRGNTGHKSLQSPAVVVPTKKLSVKYPCKAFGYRREKHPESFCPAMPNGKPDRHFLFSRLNTLTELERFLLDELSGGSNMTKSVDLIVVSLGIWEFMRPHDCIDRSGKNRTTDDMLDDVMALIEKFQSSRTMIVWRTSGFAFENSLNFTMGMNEKAMDLIDSFSLTRQQSSINAPSNLTFVDWGGAVLKRSFGDDRIKGDYIPHYGVEARHAALQMITNQVAGMQKRAVH